MRIDASLIPLPRPEDRKQPFPIFVLTIVCCLIAIWGVFSAGLMGEDIQSFPMLLSGLLLGFISIFELRVGLAILLLAIGLSPEFELFGISNFRYEDLIFPILFFVWITRYVFTKQKFEPTDLKLPLMIILFISAISSLNNHIYEGLNLGTAVLRFGKSVEYYFIFLIVLNALKSQRDLRGFILLMILTSGFVGLYGISQFSLASDPAFRISGPPGETANILGGYFVFHMCLATGLLARSKPSSRILIVLYLMLMIFPFVQTLSRTSYVACFFGFVVIWMLSRSHALGWLVIMFVAVTLISPAAVSNRLRSLLGIFHGELPASFVARIEGWKLFASEALNAPILGAGVGTARLGAVDSEYVLQLHELGIVGLIAFLWLITKCLRTSFRLQKQETESDPVLSGFALGYFGGTVALLIHSIGATTFTTIRTTEPFFFATGMLYLYWNLRRKSRKAAPPETASPGRNIGAGDPSEELFGGPIIRPRPGTS